MCVQLELGVYQRPLTRILLQKHCDTNGSRIVIQIGGLYTTFCQDEGIFWQNYRDTNGRCIAILFKSIGVKGRYLTLLMEIDSPGILVCNWKVNRKYLVEAPELHQIIPARKPRVTDALCNWEVNSKMLKVCVIILGPIVLGYFILSSAANSVSSSKKLGEFILAHKK